MRATVKICEHFLSYWLRTAQFLSFEIVKFIVMKNLQSNTKQGSQRLRD